MTDKPLHERLKEVIDIIEMGFHCDEGDLWDEMMERLDVIAAEVKDALHSRTVAVVPGARSGLKTIAKLQARVARLDGALEWIVEGRWGAAEVAKQARAALEE